MSHTNTLLSSHMAIIASLTSFDLNKPTELQHFIGATKAIPLMKLDATDAAGFVSALNQRIDHIDAGTARYGKAALEHIRSARDQFMRNNAMARNGGAHVGSSAGAGRHAT